MAIQLGKITVSPTPKPSPDLAEYVRNVGIWAREVEQAFRQVERAMADVVRDTATKESSPRSSRTAMLRSRASSARMAPTVPMGRTE